VIGRALESGRETGRVGNYLYLIRKSDETGAGTAVFLDVETRLDGLHRLLLLSAVTCVGGIGIAWLLVELFSGKAIQPLIRNAVQQKQFITDAGHELKTPLTVISANMDALELKTEPSEWIDSTREQISQMRSLVNDMIYLSRMDEDGAEQIRETVDLSALVREETESFQAMAEFTGKTLETEAEEGLCVRGDPGALRKLVSQLCDNAMKYAPEEDTIRIALKKAGREIRLTEENSLAAPLSDEALSHLFDRFYRPDASRSRESGGYGIGLSMVRAVAEKHGGRAWAERTSEGRIRFVCELPQSREA
jgi:signal transduction histidine kinase